MYRVFVRNWWKQAKPGSRFYPGLEPAPGRKTTIAKGIKSYEEARNIAQRYNATHNPGKFSRKAEFEEQ